MKRLFVFIILSAAMVAGSGVLTGMIVKAQEPGGAALTITGTLTGTSPDGGIIVDGTTYHLASGVTLPPGRFSCGVRECRRASARGQTACRYVWRRFLTPGPSQSGG